MNNGEERGEKEFRSEVGASGLLLQSWDVLASCLWVHPKWVIGLVDFPKKGNPEPDWWVLVVGDWESRYRVAIDVAKAVSYLHHARKYTSGWELQSNCGRFWPLEAGCGQTLDLDLAGSRSAVGHQTHEGRHDPTLGMARPSVGNKTHAWFVATTRLQRISSSPFQSAILHYKPILESSSTIPKPQTVFFICRLQLKNFRQPMVRLMGDGLAAGGPLAEAPGFLGDRREFLVLGARGSWRTWMKIGIRREGPRSRGFTSGCGWIVAILNFLRKMLALHVIRDEFREKSSGHVATLHEKWCTCTTTYSIYPKF